MISDQLGADWREKYVVWDPAWGTGNLTRDYQFKELYASTLEQAELEIGAKHNPEATKFKFDFLNDPLENLPAGLLEAFKQDKPVLFYLNPPYAISCGMHEENTKCHDTEVKKQMKADGIGSRGTNLYTQFLYRIAKIKEQYKLTDCRIVVFCPPSFVQTPVYRKFKDFFFKHFEYSKGAQFDSINFSDVNFGSILLSLWKSGQTIASSILVDNIESTDNGIVKLEDKLLYSADKEQMLSFWYTQKSDDLIEVPQLKTSVQPIDKGRLDGKGYKDALGYFYANGNNGMSACQRTALFSAPYFYGSCAVFKSNFDHCIVAFAARLVSKQTCFNRFDEFLKPDESHFKFNEFVNDSLIFCLFNSNSYQSSLRDVQFKDKVYNIPNNFFWLPKSEIEDLADQCNLDDVYADAHTASDRFVYKKLQGLELSKEAQAVLDKASELLKKSFKYRKLFSSEHPEYQLDKCWDAGWYQVKGLLKEYMKEELKEFNRLVKALGDKMRPMVYELGFLKK